MESCFSNEMILNCQINEIYACSSLTQFFENKETSNIEIVVRYPLRKETVLKQFTAQIGDKKIKSKILEKEKAKEHYVDAISKGNTAIMGEYSKDKGYEVNLGNLCPGEKLTLTSEFIQLILSEDRSYKFSFSFVDTPVISNAREKRKKSSSKVASNVSAELKTSSKITRLISRSNEIKTNFSTDFTYCTIGITAESMDKNLSEISLLFRTENMNELKVYEQFDSDLNLYAYTFQYLLDLRSQITPQSSSVIDTDNSKLYAANDINESPGVFIFLLDQSGSMEGKSISIAKESLKLFLQSLPVNSYFDIIGFGSSYRTYTDKPLLYESSNVSSILPMIEGIQANLGGTEIYKPLKMIYKREYDNKLSKNIFLLTDGEVNDSSMCIQLIEKHSDIFRVHAIGIGSSVDKDFIKSCGKVGKGLTLFAKKIADLRKKVIEALNSALRPYINNAKITIKNDENFIQNKVIEYPSQETTNCLRYTDEIFNYSIITSSKLNPASGISYSLFLPDKLQNTTVEYETCKILSTIDNGNNLHKAVAGIALKNLQFLDTKEEISLAERFQVVSPHTSLFAEAQNNQGASTEIFSMTADFKHSKKEKKIMNLKASTRSISSEDEEEEVSANSEIEDEEEDSLSRSRSRSKSPKFLTSSSLMATAAARRGRGRPRACPAICSVQSSSYICKSQRPMKLNAIHKPLSANDSSNKDDKNFYSQLLAAQDMFDGSWGPSKLTNLLTEKYQEEFQNLDNYFKNQYTYDLSIVAKIVATTLVIMFLEKEYSHMIDENMLLINKAKKFLKNLELDYSQLLEITKFKFDIN